MNLLSDIQHLFISGVKNNNWRYIQSLPEEYKAYVFKDKNNYGVAIPYLFNEPIMESFAHCQVYTYEAYINSVDTKLLCFSCDEFVIEKEFATVCAEFVDPGKNGENRKSIVKDPLAWWNKWQTLMGNTISNKLPYSVLAELIVYNYLLSKDKDVIWTAAINGSNDIESKSESFEVKSTIRRHCNIVTISSEYQLDPEKKLYLYFCKLEQSPTGVSINDLVKQLVRDRGIVEVDLEKQLSSMGYEKGRKERNQTYKVLEKRCYYIDSNFPTITDKSFTEGRKPSGISHIVYDLDLDVIKNYTTW